MISLLTAYFIVYIPYWSNVKSRYIHNTNIHNERIKTKYIPSYIFENEGKIFKKEAEIAEVKRVSGKFTMFKY